MSTLNTAKTEQISFSRLLWVGPVAAVAAALANLIAFITAQNLFGIALMGPAGPGSTELVPLSAAMIVIASAAPAIVATIFLAILGQYLARPIYTFRIFSIIFLIISFSAPLGLPVGTATKVTMELMHVMAAVAIVGVLTTLGAKK